MALPTTVADYEAQQNFDALERRLAQFEAAKVVTSPAGTAGAKIGVGFASVMFNASADSNTVTVTHNLGFTPIYVVASDLAFGAAYYSTTDYTATTFQAKGFYRGTVTGNTFFNWIAFG